MRAGKKRIWSCLLAICMVLSSVPVVAETEDKAVRGLPELPELPRIGREHAVADEPEQSGTYTLRLPKSNQYTYLVAEEDVLAEDAENLVLSYDYAEHVKIPIQTVAPYGVDTIELVNDGGEEELYISSQSRECIEFEMPDANLAANVFTYNTLYRITPTSDSNNIYVTGRTGQKPVQVIYNGAKYGTYKMWYKNIATDEEVFAFCCEHTKYSPVNGAVYKSIEDYSNDAIKKAAYYGYGGPANIFDDETTGLVYTHLAISYYYTGDSSTNKVCQSFLDTLDTLPMPHGRASLSETRLTGKDDGTGTLVTETVTLDAFERNKFYFNLPDQVTIHLTGGGSQTGGRCFVTGGQSFYFTAPAGYDTPYNSGEIKGDYVEPVLSLATPKSSMTQKLVGVEYEDNSDSISFEIDWEKKKKADVTVNKVVAGSNQPLSGVVFKTYEWDAAKGEYGDTEIDTLAETSTGVYRSTHDYYYSPTNEGKFKIVEVSAPEGYRCDWSKEFVLTSASESFIFTAENIREYFVKGSIAVHKEDAITGERLSGAEFKLYEWSNADGTYKYLKDFAYKKTTQEYLVSDVKGTDANSGKFKIVETKVPDGYYGAWEKEIILQEGQNSYTYTAPNTPYQGVIEVEKVSPNGKKLSGAVFEITALEDILSPNGTVLVKKGDVVANLTTDDTGTARSEKLYLGHYRVTEVKAPEGYVISGEPQDVELQIERPDQTEALVQVTFENKLSVAEVTVRKKIKESDIVWAHGNPIFLFSLEGTDIEGVAHSYACAIEFSPESTEKLVADEAGYIALEYTFERVPLGNYEVTEHKTNRYSLTAVEPNTSNVTYQRTGERISSNADIDLTHELYAEVTYTNEKTRFDDYSHTDLVFNRIPINS